MFWIKTDSNTGESQTASQNMTRRGKLRRFSAACMVAITIGLGGCSWTFSPDSASNGSISPIVEDDIQTGSITVQKASFVSIPQLKNLDEEDWRRAKAALTVALDPHGSTDRVVWDNPKTRAKGSFVSDGAPFVKNDEICRKFKTTVTDQTDVQDLQGTACRPSGGEWEITEISAAKAQKAKAQNSAKPDVVKPASKSQGSKTGSN